MKLSTLLADAATLYRRYGDIEVYVESPHHVYRVERLDPDIWNINQAVSAVIETEQVDNPDAEIPNREKMRPLQDEQEQSRPTTPTVPAQRTPPPEPSPTPTRGRRTRTTT